MTIRMPRPAVSPRVLLVSQRNLSDQIANALLYDFEDLLCELDAVDLVAPTEPFLQPGKLYKLARRCGVPRRLARSATLRPQVAAPAAEYDLLVAVLDSYRQVATVHMVEEWRKRCRKAICFFPEIWPKDLHRGNEVLELFDVFDHVFVGVHHGADRLSELVGRPCSNLHPAVDTLQFYPQPSTPRCIDVCYIGRRSQVTHRHLLAYAEDNDRFYYYDTAKAPLRVADHSAHRRLFANLVKRSRYFIANYARIDRTDWTDGVQEIGYRFFEGAAGGTVMIGQPPANDAFERLFPWPDAVVEAPVDAPDIADLIRELDADPERTARIRIANVSNALRRHDWVYRYEEMLAAVDLAPTPAMVERRAHLMSLAERYENGSADEPTLAAHRISA
jgi:hypothetical protein